MIRVHHLYRLVSRNPSEISTGSSPHDRFIFSRTLLLAMFILAYCAFLRVGEITKTNSKTHHHLLAEHVSKGIDANGLGFVDIAIPHFKHSKSNFTTIHLTQNIINPLLCPYQAITDFLNLRKHHSPESPILSFMNNTPVLRQYFTSKLQLALKFGNLNLSKYQAHIFRIGAATSAAATGYTEIQIQNMGRWKSNAFKKYIRIPSINLH